MRSTAIHFLRNDQGFRTRFHIHPLVRLVFPSLENNVAINLLVKFSVSCVFLNKVRKKWYMEEFCHRKKKWEKNIGKLPENERLEPKTHQIEFPKNPFPNLQNFSVPAVDLLKGRLIQDVCQLHFQIQKGSTFSHPNWRLIAHGWKSYWAKSKQWRLNDESWRSVGISHDLKWT